ncbi:ABC transporter permease [Clostridium sp. 19966]|uniref:ABC transporter permease n=1 Tax=Clostridium sp. 19966 TaxID=2768166 RepID=UPI0028DE3C69|nr:ABC transporter permease [Clostridium sp. 19966]MDT8715121.1 ABC transporter permease [Clostridium sp. 19966]
MNVINLFKNHFNRILTQKAIIIIALIVVPIMIGLGILFSQKTDFKATIALVSQNAKNIPQNDNIKIDVLQNKPEFSTMLSGKYAAIVEKKSDGSYEVTTIKNQKDKKLIEDFFKQGKILKGEEGSQDKRGVGTNILGFILMIILMQGVAITLLYPEDRSLKTFKRVLTAPVSERLYLLSQGIFTFVCLFIPTYAAIAITKLVFKADIGFNLGVMALLIAMLSALSTALALFIASALDSEVSLAANGIYVITSVLAGCFYSFTGNSKIIDAIASILPQKAFMDMSQQIENHKSIASFQGELIYLLIFIVALWFLGSLISKRRIKL